MGEQLPVSEVSEDEALVAFVVGGVGKVDAEAAVVAAVEANASQVAQENNFLLVPLNVRNHDSTIGKREFLVVAWDVKRELARLACLEPPTAREKHKGESERVNNLGTLPVAR
jgi:hypothetical protein